MEREWLLEMESAPGEDAVKTADVTTKHSERSVHLSEKAAVGFGSTDSNSERGSTVAKMLSSSITCCRETAHERESQLMWHTMCCLILRNCHSHPQLSDPHPDQSAATTIKARPSSSKEAAEIGRAHV